jgi:putative CocE/NonD family hydrolase
MEKLPLFLRLLRRRARKGPSARYDVRWERAVPVPAADGSPLLTDHYAPLSNQPFPTVLLRAPYVRSGFPWNYLYGVLTAEQGFHVLLQSSRGTGGSGGEFHTWHNEGPDGRAAVEWLRDQEWFTGELYTLGPSYMAFAQWAMAATAEKPPPEWKAAVMQVGMSDVHEFWWGGGAFRLERSLVGGLAMFGQAQTTKDFIRAIIRMRRTLKRVTSEVPLLDVYPSIFGGRRPAFEEWLAHPEPEYWPDGKVDLDIPVSLCTGWWDLATDQVIEQFQRLPDADLLIGPWTHTSSLEDGWPEIFEQAMRRLRGEPPAYRVRVHVGGADEWRDLATWPPPGVREEKWQFGKDRKETTFRYDPRDPTPSIGGPLQSKTQGQVDNRALERRADVVLFTGEPLTEAVEVMGPVRAELDATTTAASGDLFVRLCDVDPAGRSINVCDGLARITEGRTTVTMSHTAHRFRPGHRMRLLVAGGAHPRYLRNYGTGEPPGPATRMVATETTIRPTSDLVLTVGTPRPATAPA